MLFKIQRRVVIDLRSARFFNLYTREPSDSRVFEFHLVNFQIIGLGLFDEVPLVGTR